MNRGMVELRNKLICVLGFVAAGMTLLSTTSVATADDADGFRSIFDGTTLKGWDGNPKFWRVENGTITGQTTKDNPTDGNTFIIWRGGKLANFELTLEYRMEGGNSGIQYRSFEVPDKKWVVGGYQGDMEAGDTYSGILYGERFRGILALRGEKTVIGADHKRKVIKQFADGKKLQDKITKGGWNKYHITANGYNFVHKINGTVMSECRDDDKEQRRSQGILALQLHQGPPMKVQFRNIRIKKLPPAVKKVAFLAGKKSHGYGAHEHFAGCEVLAHRINESMPNIEATVYRGGWPDSADVLNDVDAIVVYADGGGGHPLNARHKEMTRLMNKGIGLVCIHYAVEVPKGKPGDAFLNWIGGYFETHWSVNPHWTADFQRFQSHEITRGVMPFRIHDEWYYHMRFRDQAEGVAPILTVIPPASTLSRPDGPHSGNKFVRAKIGRPQHTAWAIERDDAGRGFGFTGGHVHWNWGNDNFRKLVLNAIVWTAHGEVPKEGVTSNTPTITELEANQDYPQPKAFNRARVQKLIAEWNQSTSAKN